ncbi:MAG: carbohydrate ABC transporter permease, partial [Synechococcaceae cyanobacterium]|nr:carbohydrate ABC transporter permease [Synechococcaceae cyanobacterium]
MSSEAGGAPRSSLASAVQLALLLVVALLMLLPLLWLVSTSLKGPTEDIFTSPPALLPAQPSLAAYGRLFSDYPMGRYVLNSTVVSALAVLANLLFCSLAAYPLARLRFAGRGLVLAVVV